LTLPPPDEDARAAAAPTRTRPQALALNGVTAGWRGATDPVLIDVSMHLEAGGAAVVHGGPGAGKSTLLHVLRGAMAPRAGSALVLGSDVAALPARVRRALRRRIGYVAQAPLLADADTLFAAVAAPLRIAGPALGVRESADVADILGYLGLSPLVDEPVGALSHAQRRLAAVARAFVAQPDIVLADEPLAGLNTDAMSRVLRLLAEIARQGAAVVIATATPETFAALPAARLRLDRGRIAATTAA
jgi:cell division transport system ATP-binding protein